MSGRWQYWPLRDIQWYDKGVTETKAGEIMQFKEGDSWKACCDEEKRREEREKKDLSEGK